MSATEKISGPQVWPRAESGGILAARDENLRHIGLEDLTAHASDIPHLAEWTARFRERYCEFPEAICAQK